MDPVILFIILLILIIVGFGAVFVYLNQRFTQLQQSQKNEDTYLKFFQQMQGSVNENMKVMHERLDKAAHVIANVSKELGGMQEIGRQMQALQEFLKSPKLRGNIGEEVLSDLLSQTLPAENFSLQYKFRTGDTVDAVIKTSQGLIPIDAKFPLENFTRTAQAETEEQENYFRREFVKDVKKHIDAISKKYILPEEDTLDFAIMYVPSEAVYYEISVHSSDLVSHSQQKRILLASPHIFWHFLRTVLIGLEGKRVGEQAKEILKALRAIDQEASKFYEVLSVLDTHITNAKNAMDRVNTSFGQLFARISQVKALQGPKTDENKED